MSDNEKTVADELRDRVVWTDEAYKMDKSLLDLAERIEQALAEKGEECAKLESSCKHFTSEITRLNAVIQWTLDCISLHHSPDYMALKVLKDALDLPECDTTGVCFTCSTITDNYDEDRGQWDCGCALDLHEGDES